MYQGKRILAVVPARGGSKGVPLKNLRKVGGVSLVARVGAVAAGVPMLDRAVVSTDHEGIAQAAVAAGLAAPFRRPDALSGSIIGDWDVLDHALRCMEGMDGVQYDVIVMLQPTSPGRKPVDVEAAIRKLVDRGLDAVWSVSESDSKAHPLKQLNVSPDGDLSLYDPAGANIIARQQLQPVYHRNGVVYAFTRQCILEQKTVRGRKTGALVLGGLLPNIDTELDLLWCDFLIANKLLD